MCRAISYSPMQKEMTFGERVKLARKQKKWSQMQLARASTVNANTISQYETNKNRFAYVTHTAKLAEALGVSINWLIYGNNPPKADRELMAKLVRLEEKHG